MILSTTTDKISLITAEAGDVDVVVVYTDRNQANGAVGVSDRQLTNITTATTTDILAAPGATTERKIQKATIRNAHATTSVDVIVQFNANAVLYELHAARLYPTEMLEYTIGSGFTLVSQFPKASESVVAPILSTLSTATNPGQPGPLPWSISIKKSPGAATIRRFGIFGAFTTLTSVATVGDRTGFQVFNETLTFARETNISSNVNSVTAAVLTNGTLATLDNNTIGKAAGTTGSAMTTFCAGGFKLTETNSVPIRVTAQIEAENDLGIVSFRSGTWFQVFEPTD